MRLTLRGEVQYQLQAHDADSGNARSRRSATQGEVFLAQEERIHIPRVFPIELYICKRVCRIKKASIQATYCTNGQRGVTEQSARLAVTNSTHEHFSVRIRAQNVPGDKKIACQEPTAGEKEDNGDEVLQRPPGHDGWRGGIVPVWILWCRAQEISLHISRLLERSKRRKSVSHVHFMRVDADQSETTKDTRMLSAGANRAFRWRCRIARGSREHGGSAGETVIVTRLGMDCAISV